VAWGPMAEGQQLQLEEVQTEAALDEKQEREAQPAVVPREPIAASPEEVREVRGGEGRRRGRL